jgi:hypothetical protein
MEIYLDERTFDSHVLDNKNGGILAENFTYLLKNLMNFIDPQYKYDSVKKGKILKGGPRRMVRGTREWTLPYTITSKGTETGADVLGTKIDLDVWEINHPYVTDPDLGERYPTQAGKAQKPRGPYTVRMTSRQDIINRKGTRTYIECSCDDFQATFYEKLNDKDYTNPLSLRRSTGKKALAPAMCKHIYAIFDKEYRDIVAKAEKWVEDVNAELFGGPGAAPSGTPATPVITTTPPTNSKVAITKQDALILIKAELQKVHAQYKNDIKAYFDPRSGKKFPYHQYMFFVIPVNETIRAIAYRNKAISGGIPKGPFALLEIPNNPKIWAKFFTRAAASTNKHPDFDILWNMIRELGPMSPKLQKKLEKQLGHPVQLFEDVDYSMIDMSLIETKNSSILSSISELS